MKRTLAIATLLVSGLALGAAAQTQTTAPAGPAKIAVIAFQAAVAQTNEGQRNFADLKKKFEPRESQLKAQNDEIESLTKQLQAQGANLSDADRASRARTIDEKKKKLERDAEDLRNEGGQEAIRDVQHAWPPRSTTCCPPTRSSRDTRWFWMSSQQQNPVLYALPLHRHQQGRSSKLTTSSPVSRLRRPSPPPRPPPGRPPPSRPRH